MTQETTMTKFTEGYFTIHFFGPMAAGKTVALEKIKDFLEKGGYEVKKGDDPAGRNDHVLSVRWKV